MPAVLLAMFVALGTAVGDAGADEADGDAAFLFSYRINADQVDQFEDGYRRHLEWHEQNEDSLVWIGWTVLAGPRLGMFVDGTFGIASEAFDRRVDPRADAADAARNVTAFADPANRFVYHLRRDLGTARHLEAGRPGPMQLVAWLDLQPGRVKTLEQVLQELRKRGSPRPDYTVYQRLAGGSRPAFLLVVQLEHWAQLDFVNDYLLRPVLQGAGDDIARADVEIWRYRQDLTYFPSASQADDD